MARPSRRRGNIPAEATSFIGRRRELAGARNTLAQARLISLVGPGGVGKTRLAIRLANELGRRFGGGAWLVELAEVEESALVSNTVLTGIGLHDQAAPEPLALVLSYLRDKELLLVIDNCEHLLQATAEVVTAIIKAAPGVRVIATSREPLVVAGEHVVPVAPLAVPLPEAGMPLAELARSEAVRLFTERAAAASGTFELTEANQQAVANLCRRLDGLPLAIELAAVRTRLLTAEQILDRLDDRFSLLTAGSRAALPRHQTLRTTVEWSYDLLDENERAVFRRSKAFAGRFMLDDVEAVCTSPDPPPVSALDLLASLVDKSLVTKEDGERLAFFRLHETMREFAGVKLREAGEEEAVELRCTEHYRQRCTRSALESRYHMLEWLEWADLQIDNVRAVLRRCADRADANRGLQLTTCIGWYWATRATTEGILWLDAFLAFGGDQVIRGWAYFVRGFLGVLKADPASARPALRSAAAAARRAGQLDLLTETLSMASIAANLAGDRSSARSLLAEATLAAEACPDYPAGAVAVLQARAYNGFFEEDLGEARTAAAQGVQLARQAGDLYAVEMMVLNLASAALLGGDLRESQPLLAEALELAYKLDDRVGIYHLLYAAGCRAALSGQARRAAQLFGAADTARTEVGAKIMPFLVPLLTKAEESAAAELGSPRFAAQYAAGQRLGREAALRLALGKRGGPSAVPPATSAPAAGASRTGLNSGPLGKREAEVARLIADGLTNKEIGTRLFISERTVDSHVRNILNKLGANSRAQIAAWSASADQLIAPTKASGSEHKLMPRSLISCRTSGSVSTARSESRYSEAQR
jgi:predicted ATPase/DNA-binding CsgD family transcriptional regulator